MFIIECVTHEQRHAKRGLYYHTFYMNKETILFVPELRVFCSSVDLVSQHAILLFDSSAAITIKIE